MNKMFMNFSFMNCYFDELCHLTFMRKFMNSLWTWFMIILQKCMNICSWTIREQNVHEFFVHELLLWWTVPFNVHEKIHEYSSKMHEYSFMNRSWTKMCMNFSFMNSYFDELCHLTFMHVHEQFMFFWWTRSWTIFMNFSWIIHQIFAGDVDISLERVISWGLGCSKLG